MRITDKIVNVILKDTIEYHKLNDKFKKTDIDSFVEIKPENGGQYSIKSTGIILNKSYKENQQIYDIYYGYIVDPKQDNFSEIQDYVYTFLINENKKYNIINEPIKIKPTVKNNEEIFNAIFYNSIDCKLPLDIYKITEYGNNQYLIEPCLSYHGKLENCEMDSNSKEALIYKVRDPKICSLYYNQIITFIKEPSSNLYKSVDLQLKDPDKIYFKK